MKIMFSSTGNHWDSTLDGRFGRARGFILYDEDSGSFTWHSNKENEEAVQGAGTKAAQFAAGSGASVLITGHVGPKAYRMLELSKIKVFNSPEGSLKEVYEAFRNGRLKQQVE